MNISNNPIKDILIAEIGAMYIGVTQTMEMYHDFTFMGWQMMLALIPFAYWRFKR